MKVISKKKIAQIFSKKILLKQYLLPLGVLTLAGIINAIGVTIFLFPVKLYDGGISGLSMLLDQLTPKYLNLSLFLVLLNVPIFLFGMKKEGNQFVILSLYTIFIYSFVSYLIMDILPINVNFVSPLAQNDLFLCAIFGGMISGVGSGLTIRFGGAIDGLDVLGIIFAKRIGLQIGSFNMLFNGILYTICGISLNSWILPLYSVVTYYVGSKMVDYVVEGIDQSKCAMIVTTKPNKIVEVLSNEFSDSGTIVNATGGYSKEKKSIVYFIINHFQLYKLKKLVHEVDSHAFISIYEVHDVIKNEKTV